MNYIKEINAFRNYLKTNPLEAITQALWYVIIDYHNSCNWERWITIDNSRLMAELNITEKTLIKHRNKLIQAGLLEYKSQQRKKSSGKYRLLSFESDEVGAQKTACRTAGNITADCTAKNKTTGKNTAVHTAVRTAVRTADRTADRTDINKLNETKQNKDDDVNPYDYYQKNIGPMLPDIADLISQYQKDLPDDLITEAFKIAVRNNVRSMRYAERIMISWLDKGIKTMDAYKLHEAERANKKAVTQSGAPDAVKKEPEQRKYSQDEIEAAARYIKKAVSRYEGEDVIKYIHSLGYPDEIAESAISVLIERKELVV